MGARLALSLVSLGIAVALDAVGIGYRFAQPRGLWGTVGFAFLATAVYGLVLPRVRNGGRFAAVNIATDVAIVSGLVGFSGGVDSVFAFLFVLVAVYGALLFERRGALATAALAVFAHGLVLFAVGHRLAAGGPPRHARAAPAGARGVGRERRGGAAGGGAREPAGNRAEAHRRSPAGAHPGSVPPLAAPPAYGREPDERPAHHRPRGLHHLVQSGGRAHHRPARAAALGRDVEAVLPGIRQLALAVDAGPGALARSHALHQRARRAPAPGTRRLRAEGRRRGPLRARGDLPGRDAGGRDGARAAPLGAAGGGRPALGEHRARDPQSAGRDLRLDPGAGEAHARPWRTIPRQAG